MFEHFWLILGAQLISLSSEFIISLRTKGVGVVRMYGSPTIKSSSDEQHYHLNNTARGYDYKLTLARFLDDVFIIEKRAAVLETLYLQLNSRLFEHSIRSIF